MCGSREGRIRVSEYRICSFSHPLPPTLGARWITEIRTVLTAHRKMVPNTTVGLDTACSNQTRYSFCCKRRDVHAEWKGRDHRQPGVGSGHHTFLKKRLVLEAFGSPNCTHVVMALDYKNINKTVSVVIISPKFVKSIQLLDYRSH